MIESWYLILGLQTNSPWCHQTHQTFRDTRAGLLKPPSLRCSTCRWGQWWSSRSKFTAVQRGSFPKNEAYAANILVSKHSEMRFNMIDPANCWEIKKGECGMNRQNLGILPKKNEVWLRWLAHSYKTQIGNKNLTKIWSIISELWYLWGYGSE